MGKLQEIKEVLYVIKDDIAVWTKDVGAYFLKTEPKKLLIPVILSLLVLFLAIFSSTSVFTFYVLLSKIILVCMASYLLFRAFQQFLFAIAHDFYLNKWLKKATYMKTTVQQIRNNGGFEKSTDPYSQLSNPLKNNELAIVYIVQFQKRAGAINAKRFVFEVILLSCIIFFITPIFILAVVAVLIFTLIDMYHKVRSIFAFIASEIRSLAWNIYQYNKTNPEKCKKLIMKSEYEEIRNLSVLYNYVIKHADT